MGRMHERGHAALWVIGAIALAAAAGFGVYLVIKDRRAATANEGVPGARVDAPTPAPASPPAAVAPVPTEPAPAAPVPEEAAAVATGTEPQDPTDGMFGVPGIEGGLTRDAVEGAVRPLAPRLDRCLAQRVGQGAQIEGVMRVTLVVNRRGGVDEATSEGLDAGLAPCVLGVVKSVRFGKTSDGGKARVVYPIAFHGESADTAGACDEVACVLENYARPCCAQFKKAPGSASASDVAVAPSRDELATAFRALGPEVRTCAVAAGFTGTLRVKAKFSPAGRVVVATVDGAEPALAACVARATKALTVSESREGASVTYPFVVR